MHILLIQRWARGGVGASCRNSGSRMSAGSYSSAVTLPAARRSRSLVANPELARAGRSSSTLRYAFFRHCSCQMPGTPLSL